MLKTETLIEGIMVDIIVRNVERKADFMNILRIVVNLLMVVAVVVFLDEVVLFF
jgi:phage-related holin